MSEALLQVRGLTMEYRTPPLEPVVLFRALDLLVAKGEMLAIVGQSGAGKSTLLHLLAGLEAPTAGTVQVGDTEVTRLSAAERALFRNREIGYVWQAHYLLPEFTAAENVAMPLLARGVPAGEALAEARGWLDRVGLGRGNLRSGGLGNRAEHRAGELSGGEQQRVALARALVTGPRLLLADEPTGSLDTETGEAVFALLQAVHRETGVTTVLVTHNTAFAQRCDRTLRLRDGVLL